MAKILPHSNLTDFGVRDELNAGGGRTNNQFGSKFKEVADIDHIRIIADLKHVSGTCTLMLGGSINNYT